MPPTIIHYSAAFKLYMRWIDLTDREVYMYRIGDLEPVLAEPKPFTWILGSRIRHEECQTKNEPTWDRQSFHRLHIHHGGMVQAISKKGTSKDEV